MFQLPSSPLSQLPPSHITLPPCVRGVDHTTHGSLEGGEKGRREAKSGQRRDAGLSSLRSVGRGLVLVQYSSKVFSVRIRVGGSSSVYYYCCRKGCVTFCSSTQPSYHTGETHTLLHACPPLFAYSTHNNGELTHGSRRLCRFGFDILRSGQLPWRGVQLGRIFRFFSFQFCLILIIYTKYFYYSRVVRRSTLLLLYCCTAAVRQDSSRKG